MKLLLYLLFLLPAFIACDPSNSFKDEKKTIYFPGTRQIKQTVEYKNGMKNGYLTEYFKDGQLKARQFYVNDTLDDTTRVYHTNGKLKALRLYKNKKRHGCWQDYNSKGFLYSETCFRDDVLDSLSTRYNVRTHKIQERVRFRNGTKHGVEEHFYPSGKKKSRQEYYMGDVCIGTEEWYENGKKIPNDFTISIVENKSSLLENKLTYVVRLQDPREDDMVYRVLNEGLGNRVGDRTRLRKENSAFLVEFFLSPGGFVLESVKIAAYRKTAMGNTVIKTRSFNAASNNF